MEKRIENRYNAAPPKNKRTNPIRNSNPFPISRSSLNIHFKARWTLDSCSTWSRQCFHVVRDSRSCRALAMYSFRFASRRPLKAISWIRMVFMAFFGGDGFRTFVRFRFVSFSFRLWVLSFSFRLGFVRWASLFQSDCIYVHCQRAIWKNECEKA